MYKQVFSEVASKVLSKVVSKVGDFEIQTLLLEGLWRLSFAEEIKSQLKSTFEELQVVAMIRQILNGE
jgi:hypothetical protein